MNIDLIKQKAGIIGESDAINQVLEMVAQVANVDISVLINGESGTGKELVSKALHLGSKRASSELVIVNCGAIPEGIIESELFGHKKGAYTDAADSRKGYFETANKGTIFLDEIGDMPLDAQTRLLRVLQEGEYTSVGGKEKIKVDVRIITATNKDLKKLIDLGVFREDLYYRLNVVPIETPPLRERVDDIPELIEHFLIKTEKSGLPSKKIDSDAIEAMKSYKWPGNVRELENFILRVSALYSEDLLNKEIIDAELKRLDDDNKNIEELSLSNLIDNYFNKNRDKLLNSNSKNIYPAIIEKVEKSVIENILSFTKGNQLKASEILGLNRNTLRKKIGDLSIDLKLNDKE